jgi:hypothetical protein
LLYISFRIAILTKKFLHSWFLFDFDKEKNWSQDKFLKNCDCKPVTVNEIYRRK